MALDLRTLYVLTALTCALLGIAQLVVFSGQRSDRWVAWWGAGNLIVAIALVPISLRGFVSDFLSIPVGNALVAAGYGAMWIGLALFAGRRAPLADVAGLSLLVLLLLGVPSPISADLGNRILVSALALGYIAVRMTVTAIAIAREQRIPVAWFVALLLAAIAVTHLVRLFLVVPALRTQDAMLANPLHSLMLTIASVAATCCSMGLMLMTTTRVQRSLARAAQADPLTQVLNRGGFATAAIAPLREAARTGTSVSLLLIDLDQFKVINDREGHAAGDRMLRLLAEVARQKLRPGDLIGRHGGDEFAVLLPETSAGIAAGVADRLRQGFAEAAGNDPAGQQVTLSIGVASLRGLAASLEALLQQADAALYEAKRRGRDQVALLDGGDGALNGDQGGRDAPALGQ